MSHYELLNLTPNANTQDVERQYRALIKGIDEDDIAQKLKLYEAYKTLSIPEMRAQYDFQLLKQKLSQTTPLLRKLPSTKEESPIAVYQKMAQSDACLLPTTDDGNRRLYTRIPCPLIVQLNKQHTAKTIDISPKGMRLLSTRNIAENSVIEIYSPKIEAKGIAKFIRQRDGEIAMGIEFLEAFFSPAIFFRCRA